MRDQEVPFSTFVLSKASGPRGEESTCNVAKKKFVTQDVKSALPVWGKTSISLQQKSCSIASREASYRHRRESRSPGVSCRLKASGRNLFTSHLLLASTMADNVRLGLEQKPKPKLREKNKIGSCSSGIQEIPAYGPQFSCRKQKEYILPVHLFKKWKAKVKSKDNFLMLSSWKM